MCNCTLRRRKKANITSQASGTREACFTWIVSESGKLRSKQVFNSVFSLHHSFAGMQSFKWDSFISQSDNKDRKPVMHFILNNKETVKLET